jgi:hypothetical protein
VILAKSETGPTEKWDAIKKIHFSAVASRRKTAAVVNSPFNELMISALAKVSNAN